MRRSSQLPRTGSAYGAILSLSLSPYLSPLPLLFIDDPRGEHSGTAIRAREQNAKLYAGKKQHFAICRATLWRAYRERNNGWASRRRNERETIGTRITEILCADVVFKRRSRLGLLVSTRLNFTFRDESIAWNQSR